MGCYGFKSIAPHMEVSSLLIPCKRSFWSVIYNPFSKTGDVVGSKLFEKLENLLLQKYTIFGIFLP
jgi:hypothetical protein